MIKRILSLVLVLCMAATLLTACGGEKTPAETTAPVAGGNENPVETTAPAETEAQAPTLENPNLTIVWHTTEEAWLNNKAENPDAFDLVWSTKEVFEEMYGGTVTVIGVGWGEQQSTIISMVNSGEVCDLGQAHDQNFPIYGAKNIVQDVSQYVDLNDGFWYDSCTNAFSFGGVPYAMGAEATPVVISYNKTLFEQNGVKTPMEYFEEGNWTWETFRDVALEMTGDTDGDGENDVYGFGWWDSFYVQMLNANGIATIDYNGADGVTSNYQTAQATETFEFLQNGYTTDKFIMFPDGDSFISAFKGGNLAMTCEYGFAAITAYACDYEIEWAPLPTGPSGAQYDCGGALNGFVIPVTAANPEGAAVFARLAYELKHINDNTNLVAKYGQDQVDLMNTLAGHIHFSPIGIEKYWDANWTIFSGLTDGTPVSTFAQTAGEQIAEGVAITLEQ